MNVLLSRWQFGLTFFGTLFLINFVMGVVTGIVQEFQFGMNWSSYSIFVGNIFGAPLAMVGPLAFFVESTFRRSRYGQGRASPSGCATRQWAPWGQHVSSGERQRLSLARALLADRAVLLLDEPTRHLDAVTVDACWTPSSREPGGGRC